MLQFRRLSAWRIHSLFSSGHCISFSTISERGQFIQDFGGVIQFPNLKNDFIVLGIETSCDDTGLALVRSDGTVLASELKSQFQIHHEHGGIMPLLAAQQHAAVLDTLLISLLKSAGISSLNEIDVIGVTTGPGLELCLLQGVNYALNLSKLFNKPIVGVHHLEAHCLVPRSETLIQFPFLAVLVSGGHSQFIHCLDIGHYKIIGSTLDDALGEALDKAARILSFNQPDKSGGESLENAAKLSGWSPTAKNSPYSEQIRFTLPLTRTKKTREENTFNLSYSGNKSALVRMVKRFEAIDKQNLLGSQDFKLVDNETVNWRYDIAKSYQYTSLMHIMDRLNGIFREYSSLTSSIVVVGGVARNQTLRQLMATFSSDNSVPVHFAKPGLCTDNGIMIAWTVVEKMAKQTAGLQKALQIKARWSIEDLHSDT